MKLGTQLKEFVRPIVSNRVINTVLLRTLKLLQPVLPNKLLVRVPVNGVATCKLPNSKFLSLYAEADDPIVPGLKFMGMDAYEPETMDVFRLLASKAKVVFDVGANTGIYTIVAAVENSSCVVHAFEPVPRIYQRLEKNMLLNKVSNVRLNLIAVTNFKGTTPLYIPIGNMPTSSSTKKGHRWVHEKIDVITNTLNNYCGEEKVSQVDLIKIDTETTEPLVLEGAVDVIEASKPTIICEVLNTITGKALRTILDRFGYRYFLITDSELIEKSEIENGPPLDYFNYLFIHPSKMDEISGLCSRML